MNREKITVDTQHDDIRPALEALYESSLEAREYIDKNDETMQCRMKIVTCNLADLYNGITKRFHPYTIEFIITDYVEAREAIDDLLEQLQNK